jgi:hypothetical protein
MKINNKLLLVIGLMLLVLPMSVNAIGNNGTLAPYPDSNPLGATIYYKVDNSAVDTLGYSNGAVVGAPTYSFNTSPFTTGYSIYSDGTSDAFDTNFQGLYLSNNYTIDF